MPAPTQKRTIHMQPASAAAPRIDPVELSVRRMLEAFMQTPVAKSLAGETVAQKVKELLPVGRHFKMKKLESTRCGRALLTAIMFDTIYKRLEQEGIVLDSEEKLKQLGEKKLKELNKALMERVDDIIIGKHAAYDMRTKTLYAENIFTGEVEVKVLDLSREEDAKELAFHLDKQLWQLFEIRVRELWREAKDMGLGREYVVDRLVEDFERNMLIREGFRQYVRRYHRMLVASNIVAAAFGMLLEFAARAQVIAMRAVAKALAAIPVVGPAASAMAEMAAELGEAGMQAIDKATKSSGRQKQRLEGPR